MISKCILVPIGGQGARVRDQAIAYIKGSFSRDGDMPKSVVVYSIDSVEDTKPNFRLNRYSCIDMIKNPSGYNITIPPEITENSLDGIDQGALLNPNLGRLLFYPHAEEISQNIRDLVTKVEEGAVKEEKIGGEGTVSNNLYVVFIGSMFTGTSPSILIELPAIIKKYLTSCKTIVVTTSTLASSGNRLTTRQMEKVKNINAPQVKREFSALKSKSSSSYTYFPHYKDGKIKYVGFEVDAKPPDFLFNIVPNENSLDALEDKMAIFLKDFVLYSLPVGLPNFENIVSEAGGSRVISVLSKNYHIPGEIAEVIEKKAFKQQLEKVIKEDTESKAILAKI